MPAGGDDQPMTSPAQQGREEGVALVASLIVLVLFTSIVAATLGSSLTVLRTATSDYQGARAFYAAEAGAEAALAQVALALQDGYLGDEEIAALRPPVLEGFDWVEYTISKESGWDTVTLSDGPFAGLYAITQDIDVVSRVTGREKAHGAVVVRAKAQAIPMFQFASFGGGAMEAYTGSRADSWGRRHVNGDIYMATDDTHFHDYLTTPGRFIRDGRVNHKNKSDIHFYIENEAGADIEVRFDSEDTPDPEQFKAKSETYLDGRLRTGALGVDSLKLPLPDGVEARELITPKRGIDTDGERAAKFAWQADMYVKVELDDIESRNSVCGSYGGGPLEWPDIEIDRSFNDEPSKADKCRIFGFKWEAFFDYQERRFVDVVDVDVAALYDWVMADSADRYTRIVYIEIESSDDIDERAVTDVSGDDEYFPVLRLKNAERLPGPLTIGSEYPLYIQGNYNNIDKQPAATFGDRLTGLSNQWTDPVSPDSGQKKPAVTEDVFWYFAVVTGESEGYVGCYHDGPDPGCVPLPGGVSPGMSIKNLENWRRCGGNNRCLFLHYGSFVSLWAPVYAGRWFGPGSDYYSSPRRDWSFDEDFMDPRLLPPGTPNVGYALRAAFREAY